MLKSFSQLKKDLQKGVKVKTIRNNIKPEFNGEIREIQRVQTNAITFKCVRNGKEVESWLHWLKASNYEYEDNRFKVFDLPNQYNNFIKTLIFEYEILEG